ncbi:MAG: phosphopantetheine-binding protein, partial [Micromonosporaceae bacterium]
LTPTAQGPEAPRELAAYLVRADGGGRDGGPAESDETVMVRLGERLSQRLPGYMVPSFIDVVASLPMMPSGKVDRGRLPAPASKRLRHTQGPVVAAEGRLEVAVRASWAEAFGVEPESLSVEANFFTDLAGHSLLAARVVSLLRERGVGASPALRDLYDHPTIRSLAAHLGTAGRSNARPAWPRRPLRHGSGRIAAAGAGQAAAIYALLLIITLPVSYVYAHNDRPVSTAVLAQLIIAVLLSYLVVRWVAPVLLARPLGMGIRPGRYRLWGPTYVRLWALNLLLAIGPLTVLSGSPLMAAYLRLLGARVGSRTIIATSAISLPGLLTFGDDAAVGYGVSLRPWRVLDGWLEIAPITVGAGAFVGANAVLEPGAALGRRAALGEQSVLGSYERIPRGQRWSGSPPRRTRALAPAVERMLRTVAPEPGWRLRHIGAAVLGLLGLEVCTIAMIGPSVALVWWALLGWGVLAGMIATLPAGLMYVLTVCAVVATGKRLVLPHAPVGIHEVRSGLGVRKWIVDKLLEFSLNFTNALYATLYAAPWLRILGARVGRGSEVSTAAHLDPDLLTLGAESFVADMASVGAATYANGRVAFLPTQVGKRAFVGNAALVPAGVTLGDGSLVGVCTVPPEGGVPEGTSWLGSPAMCLPSRQRIGGYPEEQTFRPSRRLIAQRLVVEFFRATLPASLLGMCSYLYLLALSSLAKGRDLAAPALLSPFLVIVACAAVIGCCAVIKRLTVGAYRPRVEPLWSGFVRRTEFVTGLYESAAVPAGIGLLVGTPFLPPVLRWFGVQVGRRTWIGTTYLTEFDLV